MATSLLFFSPLSTSAFHNGNPNPGSSFLRSFPPLSISLPTNATRRAPFLCRTVCAAAASTNELLEISKLGISEHIVSALSRRGITELFPIQRAVLEPAMEGRDMIGRAITGSGKTLAFGIPILDKIIQHQSQHRTKRVPSALVLAPTRELARQVHREFEESAPNLSSTCLYGGIPITNQVRVLGFGVDIAIGTPGRIIDLVERGALNLSEVKFVVLDEADQMLAVGFQEDVECILNYLPAKKQCMLFSATMPSWVKELSRKYLKNPLVIDLVGGSDQKLADGISLFSVASNASGKQSLLPVLISQYGCGGKTIIFTRTRKDAEELSRSMGRIIGSKALHGNMHQFQRDKTVAAFSSGRFNVLVATDVAARGLDIPDVDLVVHFEMPNTSEIFVHRSGRTGRAGKKGTTVLMFTEGQRRDVRLIERDLGCKFEELPKNVDVGSQNGSTSGRWSSYGGHEELLGQRNHSRSDVFKISEKSQQNFGSGKTKKVISSGASKFPTNGSFSGYQQFRKDGFSSDYGGRQARYTQSDGKQFFERGNLVDFEDNKRDRSSSRTPRPNVALRSQQRSRPQKYQAITRSKATDVLLDEGSHHFKAKKRLNLNDDSFEQIFDLFKDHY